MKSLASVLALVIGFLAVSVGDTRDVAANGQFQTLNWPAEGPPRPLPPRMMNFPAYEVRTLANGLQVIAVAQNEQPAPISSRALRLPGQRHQVGRPTIGLGRFRPRAHPAIGDFLDDGVPLATGIAPPLPAGGDGPAGLADEGRTGFGQVGDSTLAMLAGTLADPAKTDKNKK